MYRSDDYYRELIFSEWFIKETKHYQMMRDGKFCDVEIDMNYPPFIKAFNKIYRKSMKDYDTRQDCYNDCMALVWEGMLKFEIRDGSNWKAIAEKKDTSNYKRLVYYLNTHVSQNIKKLSQDYKKTCKSVGKGKDKKVLHVFYNITTESLNKITTFDNSLDKIEVIEGVTDSYWQKKMSYRYDIFSEWAKKNLYNCITKSQKELIIKLQKANFSILDNEYDDIEMARSQAKLKLDRIRNKVTTKFCEERKYICGGYVIQDIDAEIKSYAKFLNILQNEELSKLDESLTKVILNSMNNQNWENLIYEHISNEAQFDIIDTYNKNAVIYEKNFKLYNNATNIKRKTLYEVVNAIHERIEFLLKAREYEFSILEKEANSKNLTFDNMKFELPEQTNILYMKVTPEGMMIQK